METKNTLKITTAIAFLVAIVSLLCLYTNHQRYAYLSEMEEDYEAVKQELNEIKERQYAINQIKSNYINYVKKKKITIDEQTQQTLENSVEFKYIYDDLFEGVKYMTTYAEKYCSNSFGDISIGFYNWRNSNDLTFLKLKVAIYESMSYQNSGYIPIFQEALGELIEGCSRIYYD